MGLDANAELLVEEALRRFDVRAYEVRASRFGVSAGSSDNYAALMNAIAAVPAGVFGKVILPPGDLTIAGGAIAHTRSNLWICGAGMDDTTLVQDYYGATLVSATGSMPSTKALDQDAVVGARTIHVATSSGVSVGDYWKLYSTASFPENEDTGITRGEWVRVKAVAGSTITLYGPLRDTYNVADGASITKGSLLTGVRFSDFSIRSTYPDGTQKADQLRLDLTLNTLVENIRAYDGAATGINIVNSVAPVIVNPVVFNRADDTANGLFGYGLQFSKATEDAIALGLRARKCRHGFTTGQPASGGAFNSGVPRNCNIVGATADECTAASFDTHSDGEAISFIGCASTRSNQAGFQMRARGSRIVGCTSSHDGVGVLVRPDAHELTVEGCQFRDIRATSGVTTGMGAYVIGAKNVRFSNNRFVGLDASGIYVEKGGSDFTLGIDGLVVERNSFVNYGQDTGSSFGRAAVYADANLPASTGWRIAGNTGRLVTPGDRSIKSGATPPYFIQIENASVTGHVIEGNRSDGVPTVRDLGGGRKRDNRRTDQAYRESQARVNGVVAQTMDRRIALSNVAALTSQKILFLPAEIEAGTRVTGVNIFSGTTALASATVVRAYLARYVGSDNMTILAVSDDMSGSALGTDAELSITFPSAVEFNDDEVIRVGIHIVATTVPTLRGGQGNNQIYSTRDRLAAVSTNSYSAVKAVNDTIAVTSSAFMAYAEVVGT